MVQLVVSLILYFVIFFGIAFILNMLLRKTWIMAFLYPIIILLVIDNLSTWEYITNPSGAFAALGEKLTSLTGLDIVILLSGFIGTIVAGIVIKLLRKSGYQMF